MTDNPTGTGFGATIGSDPGIGQTSGATSGTGFNSGASAGVNPGATTGTCAHCGSQLGVRAPETSTGLEQFLGRIGISGEMLATLRSSVQNIDVEEYLTTARDYLRDTGGKIKEGTSKATAYTKENPGKVAAGVAALAVGAGLIISALNRDKDQGTDVTAGTADDARDDDNIRTQTIRTNERTNYDL